VKQTVKCQWLTDGDGDGGGGLELRADETRGQTDGLERTRSRLKQPADESTQTAQAAETNDGKVAGLQRC
jgi:hypothetical protein